MGLEEKLPSGILLSTVEKLAGCLGSRHLGHRLDAALIGLELGPVVTPRAAKQRSDYREHGKPGGDGAEHQDG